MCGGNRRATVRAMQSEQGEIGLQHHHGIILTQIEITRATRRAGNYVSPTRHGISLLSQQKPIGIALTLGTFPCRPLTHAGAISQKKRTEAANLFRGRIIIAFRV